MENKKEILLDHFEDAELLTADGFDDAILGCCEYSQRVVYSSKKCIEILMEQNMTEDEALEYFYNNVAGAYVGEQTPIWCHDFMFE
jgi:hypothetical protein